jgi:signal transduction histidine kinase
MSRAELARLEPGLDFETLLASSIHEMKNSLGLLLSATDEVAGRLDDRDPALAGDVYRVQREAKRLEGALVQLLTLYRIGRGELSVNPGEHPVAELLEDLAAEFEPLFAQAGISLELDMPDALDWFLDEQLLASMIRNTLGNLLRHARGRVRISAREEAGWLAVRLEDDGPGYPEAVLAAAGQAPGSGSRRTGTGLGLYFVARAAAAHTSRGRAGGIRLENGGSLGGGVLAILLP